jgi:hypothetical protein
MKGLHDTGLAWGGQIHYPASATSTLLLERLYNIDFLENGQALTTGDDIASMLELDLEEVGFVLPCAVSLFLCQVPAKFWTPRIVNKEN